jgi:hypothetical protein
MAKAPKKKRLFNPILVDKENLRDPSVFKTDHHYYLFYSAYSGERWNDPLAWQIKMTRTNDFSTFSEPREISSCGFASPGDVIWWHQRFVLPFQSYPEDPCRLCFIQSQDLETWSKPQYFLDEALRLPWNTAGRLIDPTFVVKGDTLHCYFVGSAFLTDKLGKTLRGNLIGHAMTQDPLLKKWKITSSDKAIFGFSTRAPDGCENVSVFKAKNDWIMIYSEGLEKQHLALASSKDLLTWKEEGLLELEHQAWNQKKSGAPFVWCEGDKLKMLLMGTDEQDHTTLGLLEASVSNVKSWKMLPQKNKI